jgi:predicted TIM-barrel fold metal-dependent hydrolase
LLFLGLYFFRELILNQIAGASDFSPSEFKSKASIEAKELVLRSIDSIDVIYDYHTHLVGIEEDVNGTFVNPRLKSILHFKEFIRYQVYLSSLQIKELKSPDEQVVKRLIDLIRYFPVPARHYILAFDRNYNEEGEVNLAKTEFYTPNEYMYSVAVKNSDFLLPMISIHPHRKDALQEIDKWADKGVKFIKWLPNAQSIDPSNQRLEAFYKKMIQRKMILLTHAGEEKAVEAEEDQKYGNPLLLRYPLSLGVKIIIAHCASLGKNLDLDSKNKKILDNFDLFIRLMDDEKYKKNLFGDISAVVQFNRDEKILKTLLSRKDLHDRLVNGSDYPLPAVNIVIQLRKLKSFLTESEIISLKEIYEYNPILFDFVLKRSLKWEGNSFSSFIFKENKKLYY